MSQHSSQAINMVLTNLLCSAYRYYANMVNEYGPVVSFRYGRRIVCIIGRYQVCAPTCAVEQTFWG